MTREQMKTKSKSATNRIAVYVLVDEIFDDFESRTCENCKYYSPSKNIENYGVCTNDDIGCLYGAKPSFGCNQFERKDQCE